MGLLGYDIDQSTRYRWLSQRSFTKTFVVAGVSNGPTGWQNINFDDSAWTGAVAPATGTVTNSRGGLYVNTAGYATQPERLAKAASHVGSNNSVFIRSIIQYPSGQGLKPFYYNNRSSSTLSTIFIDEKSAFPETFQDMWDVFDDRGEMLVAYRILGSNENLGGGLFAFWYGFNADFYVPGKGGKIFSFGNLIAPLTDKGALGIGVIGGNFSPQEIDRSVLDVTNISTNFPEFGAEDPATGLLAADTFIKVVSNGNTTLALTEYGRVVGWGSNEFGLLGTAPDLLDHPTPRYVGNSSFGAGDNGNWRLWDIEIGSNFAMALDRSNALWIWNAIARPSFSTQSFPQCFSAGTTHWARFFPGLSPTGSDASLTFGGSSAFGGIPSSTVLPISASSNMIRLVRCGEDQTILVGAFDTFLCGRAEYGSLGPSAYTTGTGPNHIVADLFIGNLYIPPGLRDIQLQGPITFFRIDDADPTVYVLGDGTNQGGAGDGIGTVIYGTTVAAAGIVKLDTAIVTQPAFISKGLPNCNGSHNPFISGDSKVAMWAPSDGSGFNEQIPFAMYSWGYNGYFQLGVDEDDTGTAPPYSLKAHKFSEAFNVLDGAVAAGCGFLIAEAAAPPFTPSASDDETIIVSGLPHFW